MSKLKLFGKYSAAITFLAFEFFALIAFNYSGSYVLFGALSLALCVLLIIFNIAEIKTKGLSSVALFFIPLFLFVLLTTVGNYNIAHTLVGHFSWAETVFIPLGLLSMAFSGYMLSVDKNFKLKTFVMIIFSALAAYVFINFIYNIINFGWFYTIRYKGYYLYYSGIKSELPVNEFAYALEGFKFIEVKMSHYVLYPLLLLSSSVMLLYTSPRKEKVSFYVYLGFTVIALLSLVFIPSLLSLGGIAFIAVLLLVIYFAKRYVKSRKVFKYILYIGLGLFILGYLLYVILVSTGLSSNFTGFLDRLFNNNRYSQKVNPLLIGLFSSDKFLGFAVNPSGPGLTPGEVHLTGFFIFDTFMTSGVLGALGLFLFLFFGLKAFKKYFHLHQDEFRLQAALLLFVLVYLSFSAFFNDGEYALYYELYKPIYLTAPFMITVFILSYVLCMSKKEVEAPVEVIEKKEELVNE